MVEKNKRKIQARVTDTEIVKEKVNSKGKIKRNLDDPKINIKVKLSLLWVVLMFFYIYNDIFTSLRQDVAREVLAGKAAGMEVNQIFLLTAAALMSIPILMVFLSMALPAGKNRPTNISVGIFHAVLLGASMLVPDENWAYYTLYVGYEVVFIGLIIWYAWKWPTREDMQTKDMEKEET